MKKCYLISLLFIFAFALSACNWQNKQETNNKSNIQNGDIIFQTSQSSQSKAIQLASNSKYSHCGIIFIENNQTYVFEAVQPVKKTRLEEWIARGEHSHYVVKRLKNADKLLTNEVLYKMKDEGAKHAGKNYDLAFGWSDDKIYCSELVWKIYKRALGIELGKTQKLKEFNLNNAIVRKKLEERYKGNIPYEETVISPSAIFESDYLEIVKQ
jgi:uncharacterized protein YycO